VPHASEGGAADMNEGTALQEECNYETLWLRSLTLAILFTSYKTKVKVKLS
jgi:hypothetical protein